MTKWFAVGLTVVALGANSKEPALALSAWPVTGMQVVAPADYRSGAEAARTGATPVEIALKIVGPFEGATQHLIQANEGREVAVRSTVHVIRDGLLDDSVRGDRWEIALERDADAWSIRHVKRAWSCWRGEDRLRFGTVRCP